MGTIIAEIERRRLFWAICRNEDGSYTAVVKSTSAYIGDDLSGPNGIVGDAPETALRAALADFASSKP